MLGDAIMKNEPLIRLIFFTGVLGIMIVWEYLSPKRCYQYPRLQRWPANFTVIAVDTIFLRLLFPTAAVGIAILGEERSWGLLNNIELAFWLKVIIAIIVMDLAIYFQHVLFHAVPGLWRLHRMHHADLEIDVSTGLRFHPLEIILSMLIKLMVVTALGSPAIAVLIFEILLNATSQFNHSNIALPKQVDTWLRWLVVTPDMHRVHHSILAKETNSNFGFNLPLWDRIFGTYRDQPVKGHEGMTIGIDQFRTKRDLRIDQLLIQPFRRS
ncbi:MAG: sterol desaturase family protein [Oligoflexus sp.]